MESWKELLRESLSSPEDLAAAFGLDLEALRPAVARFPALVNPYVRSLIREPGDPIWRQVIPDTRELGPEQAGCLPDPLLEDSHSPVPNLIHRYPDRVLLLVSGRCAAYCRFCTRKRKVGKTLRARAGDLEKAVDYIASRPGISDVLLSGGDPLLLTDARLRDILSRLRSIPHVKILRIGTRVPSFLPQRVTPRLARLLARFHPLFLNTHFNHPREITPESREACRLLADAGIPLGNQTVLLKGVNDDPAVLEELSRELLRLRVRPYYLFQLDTVEGTGHFRVPLARGLALADRLRSRASGMASPVFAVDLPGGKGKVALTADRLRMGGDGVVRVVNYEGEAVPYPDVVE